jgi:hypothetical protein
VPGVGPVAGGTSHVLLGAYREGPPETRCSRSYLATRPDRDGSRRPVVTRARDHRKSAAEVLLFMNSLVVKPFLTVPNSCRLV